MLYGLSLRAGLLSAKVMFDFGKVSSIGIRRVIDRYAFRINNQTIDIWLVQNVFYSYLEMQVTLAWLVSNICLLFLDF